jgi:hypothetical protein
VAASSTYAHLGTAFPGFGDNHGFAATMRALVGIHTVCITAINDTAGTNRQIGCLPVTVVGSTVPIGWLDSVTAVGTLVTASGWSIDRDTAAPISVQMSVDGRAPTTLAASNAYANLGIAYPGFGDNHGFTSTMTVPVGTHTVCITAMNDTAGTNRQIGCKQIVVSVSSVPFGWMDTMSTSYQQVTTSGWTIDPDTVAPISVQLSVDGGGPTTIAASNVYANLGNAYPGYGSNHGFSGTITVPVGTHSVCVTAVNDAAGGNRVLSCRLVTATSQPPIGWLDSVTAMGRTVTASGWAIDPDTASPISVQLSLDGGSPQTFSAGNVYANLGTAYPGAGDGHGFAATVTVPLGAHTVCLTALNNDVGADRAIGCKTVTAISGNTPFGWLDSFVLSGNGVTAAGWAIDPDTVAPVNVQLVVDGGAPLTSSASANYPNLGAAYPGFGDAHGFNVSTGTLGTGSHTVCVTVVNDVPGTDRVLGCSTFAVT